MNITDKFDKFIIIIISIFCIIISILDFSDVLENLPFLKDRIPLMSLLVLSMLSIYLVMENSRESKRNVKKLEENKLEIIKSFDKTNNNNNKILILVNERFTEREALIYELFNKIYDNKTIRNTKDLKNYLKNIQIQFNEGKLWDGTTQRYPWDIEITAIDLNYTFIYHPMIDKLEQTNISSREPYSVVRKLRTGEYLWFNEHNSVRLNSIFPYHQFRPTPRFTKLYFREFKRLDTIVICESHLNVLSFLPKHENK